MKARKFIIIISSVLGAIISLFLSLYAVLAVIGCASYKEARKTREYVCDIAGISQGIAPQGLAYSKEKDVYIQTGYNSENITLLYIIKDGKATRVNLADENGNDLKGHAGGVTCAKNCVYIANGSKLHMFDLNELLNCQTNEKIQVKRIFNVDNNAAYCHSDDKYLYVGEFYRAKNYETDSSHYYTTPNGEENKAIVSVYKLNSDGILSEENVQPYPEYCISVTGLVQGFAAENGTYVLSRSYGLKNSSLEYYDSPKDSGDTITVKFKTNADAAEKEVPLLYLDSQSLYKTLTLPAFSEDVTIVNGRIAVTNEASANKYFVGKLFGSHKVYSYPLFSKE